MKKLFLLGALCVTALMFESSSANVADTPAAVAIGQVAPEIAMENPDGEMMKLSDLRGKLVLIDFWASWCGPCRRENPNVVRAYDKYQKAKFKKDKKAKGEFDQAKGFEVFSVSLDATTDRWKAAIEKDQLKWDYHVSDLQKWNNAAARDYGVSSIPMSYLIDQNGVIVGKNLRGLELDKAIDKHVAKLR